MKKLILLALACMTFCMAEAQKRYSCRGQLEGGISFRLDLEQNKDGIVSGETTYYRKNGKISKIRCLGRYLKFDGGEEELSIREFDGKKHCGYFMLNVKNGKITGGEWSLIEKTLPIESLEQTIFPSGTTYFHPATGAGVKGEYNFLYDRGADLDPCGGTCILKYANGKVKYDFCTVTPNIAEDSGTATLNGSYFNAAHGAYRYRVYVDRDFCCVWYTGKGYVEVDDWGHNASLEFIYVKKR